MLPRVQALAAEGAGTIEIKSGYGLNIESELKMLAVARRLGEATDVSVRTSLLAAHTVPPEYRDNADAYIDLICDDLLPEVAAGGMADAVDAYCESIAFSQEQVAGAEYPRQTACRSAWRRRRRGTRRTIRRPVGRSSRIHLGSGRRGYPGHS
jgi:imidazolonepropionase